VRKALTPPTLAVEIAQVAVILVLVELPLKPLILLDGVLNTVAGIRLTANALSSTNLEATATQSTRTPKVDLTSGMLDSGK